MLALFGINIGGAVEDALRALIDLLVPDFASGWAMSLVTSLVAIPDVTGPGFAGVEGLRRDLLRVGFALLSLCVVAGGLQVWLVAGIGSGGLRAGELLRRAVVAAGALAVYPTLLQAGVVGTNLATAELIRSPQVRHGLDSAFGEAFAFAAFTQGPSLGLAIPAAIAATFFIVALLVMKTGLTAMLCVLTVGGPLVLGLSPLPHAQWLVRAWAGGLVSVLLVPIAWALVFSVGALLASGAVAFTGATGPFEILAKPLAAVACLWIAYRTPGFLLAAARSVGEQPSTVVAAAGAPLQRLSRNRGGRPTSQGGLADASPGGAGGRFGALVARAPSVPAALTVMRSRLQTRPQPSASAPAAAPSGRRTRGERSGADNEDGTQRRTQAQTVPVCAQIGV